MPATPAVPRRVNRSRVTVAASCLAIALLSGCGGSHALSATSTCSKFNSASPDDQTRWVRSALDPRHTRDEYSFNGLMDAVTGHCGDNPDDKLQVLLDEHLGS